MLFDIENSREFMNLFLPEYGEDGCFVVFEDLGSAIIRIINDSVISRLHK